MNLWYKVHSRLEASYFPNTSIKYTMSRVSSAQSHCARFTMEILDMSADREQRYLEITSFSRIIAYVAAEIEQVDVTNPSQNMQCFEALVDSSVSFQQVNSSLVDVYLAIILFRSASWTSCPEKWRSDSIEFCSLHSLNSLSCKISRLETQTPRWVSFTVPVTQPSRDLPRLSVN